MQNAGTKDFLFSIFSLALAGFLKKQQSSEAANGLGGHFWTQIWAQGPSEQSKRGLNNEENCVCMSLIDSKMTGFWNLPVHWKSDKVEGWTNPKIESNFLYQSSPIFLQSKSSSNQTQKLIKSNQIQILKSNPHYRTVTSHKIVQGLLRRNGFDKAEDPSPAPSKGF